MGIDTDWLIASEGEAGAVASIVMTEEHSFDDWPSLCVEGVGELELAHLAKLLAGGSGSGQNLGPLLHQGSEDGPFVARVDPDFVAGLAELADGSVDAVAQAWSQSEHLTDWTPADVADTLRQMVEFARRARQEGKPILQLMTL